MRQGSAQPERARSPSCSQKYPGFAPFTTGVTQPLNIGEVDYDALMLQLNKRFSNNYSARVSYTLAYSRGNTSRQRRRRPAASRCSTTCTSS